MWCINLNFLSNLTPMNLYSSTTGISVSPSLIRGSLCNFLSWVKCMHRVLLLEILKPFVFAPWVTLQSTHESLHIFWSGSDAEVVNKEVFLNFMSEKLCDAVFFFMLNSIFLLVDIRKGWSDSDSEFPVQEKTLYADLSLFQTSRRSPKPFPDQRRLRQSVVFECWPLLWRFPIWLPESILGIGDKFVGLEKTRPIFCWPFAPWFCRSS